MALFDRLFSRPHRSYRDEVDDGSVPNNPNGREFMDVVKHSIGKTVEKYSVTANSLTVGGNGYPVGGAPFGSAGMLAGNTNVDLVTGYDSSKLGLSIPVDTNKMARIQSYDNIARYPELDWCIDEIANDFLHKDIDGDYMKLRLNALDGKFKDGEESVVQEEFRHMVAQYDLDTVGFNMIRKFLIEGEVCFENVIDPKHPDYGIIGFKYIPTVFYDFLRNRDNGQLEGICLDPERIKTYAEFSSYGGNAYAGANTQFFNAIRQVPAYSYTYSMDTRNKIVMPFEQVTYMNSGKLSEDGAVVFPPIEKVVVPTRQLLLMHDAIVIYRITRAPEKLVFNIDMAGMPSKKARELVRRMAADHKSRKAVQGSGAVTNVYNAETMLDAYYFWKTGESSGTQVQNIAGTSTAHYNELNDVEYFLKRILKFLNIPWSRWSESQANRQDKNSIQNEEYSFAQAIVRYQTLFAAAVKKTFITHLRLKGIFDKYDLHESEFEVTMNPPSLFEIYQQQNRFSDALDIIAKASSLEFVSKNIVMKKVLNWTDKEVHENEVEVRREALRKAQNEWAAQQIAAGAGGGQVWLDTGKYLAQPAGQPPVTQGDPNAQPPQDDSGTTAAEVQMPPNPEFGDFAAANSEKERESAKIYPENGLGIKELDGNKASMGDVFDTQFGVNPNTPSTMTGTFDKMFDGFGDRPKSGSLGAEFEKQFGSNGVADGGGHSLSDTFDRAFDNGDDSDRQGGAMTDVFKAEFGDSADSAVGGCEGGGEKELMSLDKVFDDNFGEMAEKETITEPKVDMVNVFDYAFGKDSVPDAVPSSGGDDDNFAASQQTAKDLNDAMAKMFSFVD